MMDGIGHSVLKPLPLDRVIWNAPFSTASFQMEASQLGDLDINQIVELKQQAIATYRSQTTNLIDDAPEGFRLTPQMLANFTRPWEVYLEEDRP